MFKTISRLLFGGEEEEASEDVRTKELEEEGWHVVTHQEADSAENPDVVVPDIQPAASSLCGSTAANTGADCNSDTEPAGLSGGSGAAPRAVPAALFQPKALAEVSRLTCVQKARAWADRHCASRNAIQRQNRLRQGVQPHAFQLQQPGHRSLCH